LFFGNNQSLTYFNPEDINAYPTNGRVLITGLEVDNHPVGTGEKGCIFFTSNTYSPAGGVGLEAFFSPYGIH